MSKPILPIFGCLALTCAACDSAPSAKETETLAAIAELENAVADTQREVARLKDVDELENLAGIYGHYVDKSRHDDVADLFAPAGVVEILGRGVFIGQDRVREYMRNLTPGNVGPREGSLFNHMHEQPVVHVSPDGDTADGVIIAYESGWPVSVAKKTERGMLEGKARHRVDIVKNVAPLARAIESRVDNGEVAHLPR